MITDGFFILSQHYWQIISASNVQLSCNIIIEGIDPPEMQWRFGQSLYSRIYPSVTDWSLLLRDYYVSNVIEGFFFITEGFFRQ